VVPMFVIATATQLVFTQKAEEVWLFVSKKGCKSSF